MKKIIFSLMAITMILFASCSNETNYDEAKEQELTLEQKQEAKALLELQSKIEAYNVATFAAKDLYYDTQTTRASWWNRWWQKIKKTVVVIFSDIIGGLRVSNDPNNMISIDLIASSTASANASKRYSSQSLFNPISRSIESDTLGYVTDFETAFRYVIPAPENGVVNELDSIGYYHNKVLYRMFSDKSRVASYRTMTDEEFSQVVYDELSQEDYIQRNFGDGLNNMSRINLGLSAANDVISSADAATDEDDFFSRLSEVGLTDANIISVLEEVMEGLANIAADEDDGTYFQGILDMIQTSNLNHDVKRVLRSAVIIGQASNHLWTLQHIGDIDDGDDDYYDSASDDLEVNP